MNDKYKHFVVGMLISLPITAIGGFFAGILVTGFIGLIKEIRDAETGKGTPEAEDAFWTLIGGVIGALIFIGA